MMPLLHHYLAILKLYFELILKLKCRTSVMVLLQITADLRCCQTDFLLFFLGQHIKNPRHTIRFVKREKKS